MAFVADGGYENQELWAPEDWKIISDAATGRMCPATWTLTEDGDVWVHYPEASFHWRDVQDRPVWCSLAEARAFCAANKCRLMTEPEYERALAFDPHGHRLQQLQSGGWEWTGSVFAPLPGFQPMESYEAYSTDFFNGQHYILRGSCDYTHASLHRPSFRNFYQAAYPHVFAKFRCCR
jgi:formylglycine-generating enzyme required for sulfatase activity